MSFDAFYLPTASGQRFCLVHEPDVQIARRGAIVYVHPFAEEMNKSRRMAALQAKAMAAAGYVVLQIDLHGCGDSSGDFGDASWASWVDDVCLAYAWLQERGESDVWLWGLRTGCLLACAAAARIEAPGKLLLWQPVLSGKQYLQQFLRMKMASEMLGGESKGAMDRLRERLAQGEAIEIAGYQLAPNLESGLEKAELTLPEQVQRIEWFELSGKPEAGLSPAASARIEKWQAAGARVRGQAVIGPPFWQTAEIAESAALIDASVLALSGQEPA